MIWASSWLIAVAVPSWCSARVNGVSYGYAYDSIGNREFAVEGEDTAVYTANALNQYTRITENAENVFIPEFDADGNQTRIKTSTSEWSLSYNGEKRPVSFTNEATGTVVEWNRIEFKCTTGTMHYILYAATRRVYFRDWYIFNKVETPDQIRTDFLPSIIAGDGTPYYIEGETVDSLQGFVIIKCNN